MKCPICNKKINDFFLRYKKMICFNCVKLYKCYTKDGKKITFSNFHDYGLGVKSKVEDENNYGREHLCYINNVLCKVSASRFGGVVYQKLVKE